MNDMGKYYGIPNGYYTRIFLSQEDYIKVLESGMMISKEPNNKVVFLLGNQKEFNFLVGLGMSEVDIHGDPLAVDYFEIINKEYWHYQDDMT